MGLCLWYLLVDPWEGAARGPAKLCRSFVSGLLCKEGGCHGAVPSLPLWHPQVPAQPPSTLGRAAAGQPRAGDTWSTGVSALSSAAAESRGVLSSWQQTQHLQSHLCLCPGVLLGSLCLMSTDKWPTHTAGFPAAWGKPYHQLLISR